ncbi:squalene/phytoene synthase family protein [Cognatishimia maritima]|uniref:Squalene/phytoene synthase n=1 Tax=Cognatishimia maritima TaxID=870908 RepID=A0A1M5J5J2_9RHOB|nr:Squalene/phytoene synthase [Cognatishimia maritima]
MNPDIAACAGIVQKGDPDRFLAIMSGPVALREKLFPLYAMNVEVARAPWVTQESMIAEMRLQWWRDALDEIATGGQVRRHEVVTPLASILSAEQAKALDELVLARRWDIYKDPFEDAAQFHAHLEKTSGLLLSVAWQLAGGSPEADVSAIGYADGLARWFQAIPALEASGRLPLVDGRAEAVASLATEALAGLAKARRLLGRVSSTEAAALRTTWLAEPVLRQVSLSPTCVADGTIHISDFRKKSSLLWKSLNASW